jgi:phage tail-like protein
MAAWTKLSGAELTASENHWVEGRADEHIGMGHRFKVTIAGFALGGWQKISGLHFQVDKTAVSEGGTNSYQPVLLGVVKWDPVQLSRVVIGDEWHGTLTWLSHAIMPPPRQPPETRELVVQIQNAWGATVRQLCFQYVRPIDWKVADLDTSKPGGPALETLTFVHRGLFPAGTLIEDAR